MEENHIHTGLKIFNRPDKEICPIEEAPLKERAKRLLINTRGLKDISELRQFTKLNYILGSYHPCSLCDHHYRRRGKRRKYEKAIFCDLTNEYIGHRSAEELGCEHFESKYERKKSDGKNNRFK